MKVMKTPIRIKVTDIVGSSFCVSSDDGNSVYEKLAQALQTGREIELDFVGIDMVISAFLNAAIGRLVEHHKVLEIHERIHFVNLCEEDQDLIERVIANAERYYENPDRFRALLESDPDEDQ
jgi:hypothetical protein